MMTFTGIVGPSTDVGPIDCAAEQVDDWTAGCPLWVSGTGGPDWRRWVPAPHVVVDVFGFSRARADHVCSTARTFARNGDLGELDALATGSGVLVVREPQRITVLTDLAGVWPVFYATVGGVLVYSSSASAVGRHVGGEVDERWLAARLLAGGIPDAWSQGSAYRRVAAVPPSGVLMIDRGGWPVLVRRELPLGTTGFAAGAPRLAGALTSAVRGRMGAHRTVSADLSGGLDSSTVAALAATTRPDPALSAITLVAAELRNDDPAQARRVAAAVSGLHHLELPLPGEVDPYAALTEMPHTDEPFEDVSIFARLRWWMTVVGELGCRAHLTGDGGDAVLIAPPAYLADLARCRRRGALWQHAAGWARLRHRPVHRLIGAARRVAHTSRAQAIEQYASALELCATGRAGQRCWEDLIGWVPAHPCRRWFTPHGRAVAAAALRDASHELAEGVAPGDTASVGVVQAHGRAHRSHVELAAGHGVALHAPYLDDAVVTACLAVPAAERTSPRQVKPLLRAAMTGRVPDAALSRSTKGDYSMLAYRGLSRHHRTIGELLTNSRLASLGLIDEKAIRSELLRGVAGLRIPLAALDQVLGAEIWLRTGSIPTATKIDRREFARA